MNYTNGYYPPGGGYSYAGQPQSQPSPTLWQDAYEQAPPVPQKTYAAANNDQISPNSESGSSSGATAGAQNGSVQQITPLSGYPPTVGSSDASSLGVDSGSGYASAQYNALVNAPSAPQTQLQYGANQAFPQGHAVEQIEGDVEFDTDDEDDDDDDDFEDAQFDPLIGVDDEGMPFFNISEQEAEERRTGRGLRHKWLNFVNISTFFVPDAYIRSKIPGCLGPSATEEQLIAWREKLTMFNMLLGVYVVVAMVFLLLPILFCTQKPGEKTGLISKDVWYCWTYDIFVLFYSVMSGIVVIFTLYAAIRIRFQTEKKRQDQSDSLVILHIPCYSEDEEILRKTIDSVVATDFPDTGKLLWVIADGLVVGRGAAKSTPEILVEDIFHSRDQEGFVEPLPKTYMSAGHDGAKLNAAKTYSGLFTVQGHTCPYIVSVKTGMPDEANAAKPGNRGKRDSQIIIYSFLYHYNFDRENMSELDHELAKCMFDLGIDPADLDYMLLTDADSYVRPNALDLLVNYLDGDPSSIGACGETKVDNKLTSFICSIQTFEYFITHVVLKAFEGYYSKVLVLSGCFSLYRIKIRDEDGVETPGIISPHIIEKYLGAKHKSLHEHNLLSIGEDRYFSTAIIRTFPEYDTVYVPSAICTTSVPENFQVLLSQRRRWTNSLVHCHFDHMMYPPPFKSKWMSFYFFLVLFLELWMVFMLPLLLTCGFLFLFYFAVIGFGTSGLILTVVLFCVPAFVVSFTGRWHQFFYWIPFIMGTPIFSILIPVYSMWKMDEFGWGTSRATADKPNAGGDQIPLVTMGEEGEGQPRDSEETAHSIDSDAELQGQVGMYPGYVQGYGIRPGGGYAQVQQPMVAYPGGYGQAIQQGYATAAAYEQQMQLQPGGYGYYAQQPAAGGMVYYQQQPQQPAEMDPVALAAREYEIAAARMAHQFAQSLSYNAQVPLSPIPETGDADEDEDDYGGLPNVFATNGAVSANLAAAYEQALARLALTTVEEEGDLGQGGGAGRY